MIYTEKSVNPLEVIVNSESEIAINKAVVVNIFKPENVLDIDGAQEDAWRDSPEIHSVSTISNKVSIKIRKEQAPTTHGLQSEAVKYETVRYYYPPGSDTLITRNTTHYCRKGELLDAQVSISSEFVNSNEDYIVIPVAEMSFDPIEVDQKAMSDIWVGNLLYWTVVEFDESDSDDSDSDQSDHPSDSDSDSDSDSTPPDPDDSDYDSDS